MRSLVRDGQQSSGNTAHTRTRGTRNKTLQWNSCSYTLKSLVGYSDLNSINMCNKQVCTTVSYTISRTPEISRHTENRVTFFFFKSKLTTVQSITCIDIQYYGSINIRMEFTLTIRVAGFTCKTCWPWHALFHDGQRMHKTTSEYKFLWWWRRWWEDNTFREAKSRFF